MISIIYRHELIIKYNFAPTCHESKLHFHNTTRTLISFIKNQVTRENDLQYQKPNSQIKPYHSKDIKLQLATNVVTKLHFYGIITHQLVDNWRCTIHDSQSLLRNPSCSHFNVTQQCTPTTLYRFTIQSILGASIFSTLSHTRLPYSYVRAL